MKQNFFLFVYFYFFPRNVQQSGHAEPPAADLGKPPTHAEHAVGPLHAQHDAVAVPESRVGLPGGYFSKSRPTQKKNF